jgi:electron transfer flavoprotein beta subunit
MAYHCIVLAKQVPDTKNVTGEAMRDDGTVNRAALPAIFNPEDLHALEAALDIRDRFGGKVTVVTMGPPAAVEILRESYYRGVDDVVLLTDRRFAAADTLATSYALSCAINKLGDYDMILCGRQAIDGDTAQVGPQTAEKLGINQVTYVENVLDIADGTITIERAIEGGSETVKTPLPLLMTVMDTANEPRPASAKGMLQYRYHTCAPELHGKVAKAAVAAGEKITREETAERVAAEVAAAGKRIIKVWDADDVNADGGTIGGNGSPTKVKNIESVILSGADLKSFDPTEEGCEALVKELVDDHILG